MKKTILSLVTISAIATTGVLADSTTDIAQLKTMMQQMNKRLAKLEAENKQLKAQVKSSKTYAAKKHTSKKTAHVAPTAEPEKVDTLVKKYAKATPVFAKTSKLAFSGTHYIHFVSNKDADGHSTNKFGVSRNYVQVKGYFFEDPKSYMRVTLDAKQNSNFDTDSLDVRVKYAYLYLNNILPFTGAEIGLTHTPWLDFEEHHGWRYRSIGETFSEQHNGGHLQTSSDYGINFKSKTEYFSSELGIFNGAGYHGDEDGEGLRGAWRLTGHLLGTGKAHVHKDDTYADVSFFGQYGQDESSVGDSEGDYVWYGVHAVYNQPEFLFAAQYIKADKADDTRKGDGWSVNGEFRLNTLSESLNGWNVLARYDDYTLDTDVEKKTTIAGVAYRYNKNIEFVVDYQKDEEAGNTKNEKVLLTTEVNW